MPRKLVKFNSEANQFFHQELRTEFTVGPGLVVTLSREVEDFSDFRESPTAAAHVAESK